ncbi:glucodextranase DOMON-like domain-containing protein [Thermoflexus sp.]|uniref:glucodextranase DOMON-like domain-containing protein n=1 Tax=Thermoflexus sp. TaxID=1969742 RepID=UPI0035E45092
MWTRILLLWVLAGVLASCRPTPRPTPTALPPSPTPSPAEEPLYLALIWHQHQPFYPKDPQTGLYTRPWARVHATKDYYDMAAILRGYPNVHVTFNLTPALIRQLEDLAGGAKDIYWALAEKPADALTDEEKRFVLRRFFDANWDRVIPRFPRYRELLEKRGRQADPATIERALAVFTVQDFRDLQVLFNLAWFDPDFLNQPPLEDLVRKGRDFTEADKQTIFQETRRILREILPLHKALQDAGQIEVTTTPYAHPILPLIVYSDLARVGNPEALLPDPPFVAPEDAREHLRRAAALYEAQFGRAPRGLWPAEGAVAQQIIPMVIDAGFVWIASGEPVLARSLGLSDFTRDAQETVEEIDLLYRPYRLSDPQDRPLFIVFRDGVLSDKIGFTYSGMPGEAAAEDFIRRLERIRDKARAKGVKGPLLVSVILDGENAWEYYENDGKAFLHGLYRRLNESRTIRTVTPSEFLRMFPEAARPLPKLFPGAWFSPNYDTWIGEVEEREAWTALRRTRQRLTEYEEGRKPASAEALGRAREAMLQAEGSDWFWWYGSDQDSGQDDYFDEAFRSLLRQVYEALGEPVPDFLSIPIVPPRAAEPATPFAGPITPTIDGRASSGEWDAAARYAGDDPSLQGFWLGADRTHFYVRVDGTWEGDVAFGFYIAAPQGAGRAGFSMDPFGPRAPLGFGATHAIRVIRQGGTVKAELMQAGADGQWVPGPGALQAQLGEGTLELALPQSALGSLQAGDPVLWKVIVSRPGGAAPLPAFGVARFPMPDFGLAEVILDVEDPERDDHGPGSYVYPTDPVFLPQVFDLKRFQVGREGDDLVFRFEFYGPIPNPWGSPNGLALQTIDVYIDRDPGKGTGARLLLPGRNAALAEGFGWEIALWAEGWTPGVYAPDAQGKPKPVPGASLRIAVNPNQRTVLLRVPQRIFGAGFDPQQAAYLAVVLSQEGFPSPGVWRVRDVLPRAAQWRLGGGPEDTNHTRILDVAWPAGAQPTQEEMLSAYRPSQEMNMDRLGPEDFAQLRMRSPSK